MQQFSGKTAFISGGASGIGLALAKALLAEGMNVAIADVEAAALERAQAELGDSVLALQLDVTDRPAYAVAADAAEARFGNIHLACNNAGVLCGGLRDAEPVDFDWVLGVNLMGVINGSMTFAPRLKAHGEGGHILNTVSIAGVLPGNSIYNISKSAAFAYTEGLHMTLAQDGIGVSALCPGLVDTDLFTAERNRPAHYQRQKPQPKPTQAQLDEGHRKRMPTMITAEFCAQRALDGIRNDELFIFTHPELKAPVEARFKRILAAMDGIPQPTYMS